MRAAGIDPGTIRTGIGILEVNAKGQFILVHAETIKADAKKPLSERLRMIHGALKEVLMIYRPETVAIESVFFSKDVKAAVKIGEARGIAMLAALDQNIPVSEYPPARVKEAVCGNGRAHKSQIQFMIKQILSLKEEPEPDTADALAIAICHMNLLKWNSKKALAAVK